jgi:hypothetical protein
VLIDLDGPSRQDDRQRLSPCFEQSMPSLPNPKILHVVITGGGPAGLSAALVPGRCLRTVLVCDAGSPRNAAARINTALLEADAETGELSSD